MHQFQNLGRVVESDLENVLTKKKGPGHNALIMIQRLCMSLLFCKHNWAHSRHKQKAEGGVLYSAVHLRSDFEVMHSLKLLDIITYDV